MEGVGVMRSGAQADSALWATKRRTVLAVGVFQRYLAVSKGEQITTMDFDASAVRPRSREYPLGNSSISLDEMAGVAPVSIGKGRPDFSESGPHCLTARVPGAADVWTCRGFKNTVIAHERHEGIDIVAIPRIGKGLQGLAGDRCNYVRHDLTPFGSRPDHEDRKSTHLKS